MKKPDPDAVEVTGREPRDQATFKRLLAHPLRRMTTGRAQGRTLRLVKVLSGNYLFAAVVNGEVQPTPPYASVSQRDLEESVDA